MPKVLLGDVAKEHKETCKGSKEGYPIVGLEHLVPEEVNLTQWSTDSEKTFTKMFRKGNVLFGRRRAYLKKAAVAPFDGICSGDITVIEALPDKILPELLPFVIQNDSLFEFAVGKSAGSLSPRVKWEHLKNYEFELPNLKEQKKLVEVLWAMYETKCSYKKLIQATDELVKSQFIEMFGDPIENDKGWKMVPLLETGKCKNGMNYSSKDSGIVIRCLGVADFQDNAVIDDMAVIPTISLKDTPGDEYLLRDGDIVFVRSNGNKALVGRCVAVYPGDEAVTYSGFCIRYRKETEELLIDYLLRFFKMDAVRTKMAGRGANIQNLNQQILAALKIPVPPKELQQAFSDFVRQSDKSKFELENALNELTATYKRIISENLG